MYLSIKVSPEAAKIINRAGEIAGEKGSKEISVEALVKAIDSYAKTPAPKEAEKKTAATPSFPTPAPNLKK